MLNLLTMEDLIDLKIPLGARRRILDSRCAAAEDEGNLQSSPRLEKFPSSSEKKPTSHKKQRGSPSQIPVLASRYRSPGSAATTPSPDRGGYKQDAAAPREVVHRTAPSSSGPSLSRRLQSRIPVPVSRAPRLNLSANTLRKSSSSSSSAGGGGGSSATGSGGEWGGDYHPKFEYDDDDDDDEIW